jgi:hypothetical protein
MSNSRGGYPLGALFVLVTVCAVLVAGMTPQLQLVARGKADIGTMGAAMGAGAVCGLLVGIVMGLLQFRIALGVAMGAMAGTVIGAAGGAMALLTGQQLATAAVAITAGSGFIIGVALLMRRAEV